MKFNNLKIGVIFLLLFFILLNCGQAKKPANTDKYSGSEEPEWVNNPHDLYPESQYIVGVGSGDTKEVAENNAIGSISKVFQSKVKVDQTVIENYLEQEKNGNISTSGSSRLINNTNVGSKQDLKNINIDKSYFSPNEGLYYVLAYLNRKETAAIYRKEIANNDLKIEEYHGLSLKNKNKLTKYAYLLKAKTISDINNILNEQYGIIRGDGSRVAPLITESQLNKELRELTQKITVNLQTTQDTPAEVGDYVKEAIGKFGFKIVNSNSDFTFKFSLDMKKTDIGRANTVGYNWKFTLTVQDNINNYSLDTYNMKNRTIAISGEEAKAKIMHKVKKGLTTKFYKQFLNYMYKF
jgi:hypothetical protein